MGPKQGTRAPAPAKPFPGPRHSAGIFLLKDRDCSFDLPAPLNMDAPDFAPADAMNLLFEPVKNEISCF